MKDAAAHAVTPAVHARIAGRVRALRARLGLTLDALAAKCDVSRSMISLVERGESSPTAAVLEQDCLRTRHIAGGAIRRRQCARQSGLAPRRTDAVARSAIRLHPAQFVFAKRSSPIQIVQVLLPAHANVAHETGARDVTIHQQIWIQEEADLCLAEDDCLVMQRDEPTAFRNRTRKPARYIVVIATDHARGWRR